MRLLADANVETSIVQWQRTIGHDVIWAAEMSPAIADEDLLRLANGEGRAILTHDKDFGEMVFREALSNHGIVLMRFRAPLQSERLAAFQTHWPGIESRVHGRFVVMTERRVRTRVLPSSQ